MVAHSTMALRPSVANELSVLSFYLDFAYRSMHSLQVWIVCLYKFDVYVFQQQCILFTLLSSTFGGNREIIVGRGILHINNQVFLNV